MKCIRALRAHPVPFRASCGRAVAAVPVHEADAVPSGEADVASLDAYRAQPGRANDVAWIEALVAEQEGRDADAAALRREAREASDPSGEFPGLLVIPSSSAASPDTTDR